MAREHKRQVTVLLEPEEERRFSAYCDKRGFKKSTLIARLIREHLDEEGFQTQGDLFETAPRSSTRPKSSGRGKTTDRRGERPNDE